MFEHRKDQKKNITVTMEVDEEEKRVEWDGLPQSAAIDLENFTYRSKKMQPEACLNMVLRQQTEEQQGLQL